MQTTKDFQKDGWFMRLGRLMEKKTWEKGRQF